MRRILLTALTIFISFSVFGAETMKKIMKRQGSTSYICKQKELPLSIEYQFSGNTISVDIKAESDLKSFQVEAARGVDGLRVLDFKREDAKDLKTGEVETYQYQFSRPSGRSYFVMDVSAFVYGKKKYQIVSIPLGKLSSTQLKSMKKNVSEVDAALPDESPGEVKKMKLHRMKIKPAP